MRVVQGPLRCLRAQIKTSRTPALAPTTPPEKRPPAVAVVAGRSRLVRPRTMRDLKEAKALLAELAT
jgi:hypothetical protein